MLNELHVAGIAKLCIIATAGTPMVDARSSRARLAREVRPEMNPRIRRLEADYRELRARFDGDPNITITPIGPMPPEKYQLIYRVQSLRLDGSNSPVRSNMTVVTLTLPADYPRGKPYAETIDQVFHPNFGAYVCIADFWAPGQTLADIVASIGDMLQYKKYNIRSPLNAVAAEWANTHAASLPIGNVEIGSFGQSVNVTMGSVSVVSENEGGTA